MPLTWMMNAQALLGRICKLKIDTSCSGRKRENMSILISENQPE